MAVATPPTDGAWVHGDQVTSDELDFLAEKYKLDRNVLHDVLDKHELPRVEVHSDGMYVFVRIAQKGSHSSRIGTTPVLLAVKGKVFITVSTAATASHDLATPSVMKHAVDPLSLLLGTFASILNDYESLMQHTAQYIHDTARRLRTHEVTNDDFIQFVTVEDNLNEYRMNLSAMLVVAERMHEVLARKGHGEAIDDILLYIKQLLVEIDSYSQSVTSIRNAYGTVANNILNQRMKTLTALTVLIALPNVVYGMYGMNVTLPYQEEPWVYAVIVSFSLSVIAIVLLVGRRRGMF